MSYQPLTYAIGAGAGGIAQIPNTIVSGCTLVAEAECWVQPLPIQANNNTAPSAPTQSPAPAVNQAATGWLHLRANDAITIGFDSRPGNPQIAWLRVWGVGVGGALTGYLQIVPTLF